jgi:hypothetical protein
VDLKHQIDQQRPTYKEPGVLSDSFMLSHLKERQPQYL